MTFASPNASLSVNQVICLENVLMADGRSGHISSSPVQDLVNIAADPTDPTRMWVALENHGIVVRMKDITTNPRFDVVIGKTPQQIDAALTNSTALRCNSAADTNLGPLQYCIAFDLTTDPLGNLYVTEKQVSNDGLGTQLFIYPHTLFPDTQPNQTLYLSDVVSDPVASGIETYGVGNPTSLFSEANCNADDGCQPFQPTFSATGNIVLGGNGYARGFIPSPPMAYVDPQSYPFPTLVLGDAHAQLMDGVFDEDGNFISIDWNYSRILIYRRLNAWLDSF
jgi:hypothetical protein